MRALFALAIVVLLSSSAGASVIDFDSGPSNASLPLDYTADGVTAHFVGGYYTLTPASYIYMTPAGFSGLCLMPSGVSKSDLEITFSQPISNFSIMFAPDELACDSSATIRGTAYLDGTYKGTHTAVAPNPGTYPTGTLTLDGVQTGNQAFNKVVVHYDAPPPTGGDYGVIFLADNVTFTAAPVPEAGTVGVLAAGVVGLWTRRRTPINRR
jgi:hypothetical protein